MKSGRLQVLGIDSATADLPDPRSVAKTTCAGEATSIFSHKKPSESSVGSAFRFSLPKIDGER